MLRFDKTTYLSLLFKFILSARLRRLIFSKKTKKINHPPITCSKRNVSQTSSQKHLDS